MIKKETILSVFDKKLTLLQYLKEIKSAIEDSIVESFSCDQIDTTHVKFALNFADGTKYETDAIEVPTGPQGEIGPTPNISVSVSAETLEPNESATASVEQGGTPAAPTIAIAFGIPKGEKGDAGTPKLYLHEVSVGGVKMHIFNFNLSPFTQTTFEQFLQNNGYTSADHVFPCFNADVTTSVITGGFGVMQGVYYNGTQTLKLRRRVKQITINFSSQSISQAFSENGMTFESDIVIEM